MSCQDPDDLAGSVELCRAPFAGATTRSGRFRWSANRCSTRLSRALPTGTVPLRARAGRCVHSQPAHRRADHLHRVRVPRAHDGRDDPRVVAVEEVTPEAAPDVHLEQSRLGSRPMRADTPDRSWPPPFRDEQWTSATTTRTCPATPGRSGLPGSPRTECPDPRRTRRRPPSGRLGSMAAGSGGFCHSPPR